jgi:hypothetical protein
MVTQPTETALRVLARLSLGWSADLDHAECIAQAAFRLHLMATDLLASHFIEDRDLFATSALYRNICKKTGEGSCQSCISPLLECPRLYGRQNNFSSCSCVENSNWPD